MRNIQRIISGNVKTEVGNVFAVRAVERTGGLSAAIRRVN
jgi:hypothetical protein